MNIPQEKQSLRKKMMQLRDHLKADQKEAYDQWISEQLWLKVETLEANIVHVYLPMKTEIDIYPFIKKALSKGKTLVCPKTLPKRQLEHLQLLSLSELEEGLWGTKHPASGIIYKDSIDLIVIPGLAFDLANYRLGYGAGYYDHFLEQYPKAYKLAVAYPFQMLETVPKEQHDVQLDEVLYQPSQTGGSTIIKKYNA